MLKKSVSGVAIAMVCSFGFAVQLHAAQIVSYQYQTNGSPLVGADSAGVAPAGNWNSSDIGYVVYGNYVANALHDSANTATSINVSTVSQGGFDHSGESSFTTGSGDWKLYHGFALGQYGDAPNVTVTLTGLDSGKTYTLYTYVGSLFGAANTLSGTVNGTTYYLNAATLGTYTRGTATSAGAATDGNYFQFDNLTGSTSQTFVLVGTNSTSLYGLQLVEAVNAPEPAGLGLIGWGAMTLLSSRRRRV